MADTLHIGEYFPGPLHPFFREKTILFPVLILTGIGLVMVYSASCSISMDEHNTLFYYLKRQSIFLLVSFVIMYITASLPYRLYKSMAYIILFAAIGLLVAVLIPAFGIKANNARRWLNFGLFAFQPAEFAKLAMILFMAYSLSKKEEMGKLREFSIGVVPHAVVFALMAVLILCQPDFGTIVVMGMICWGMMFIAGVPLLHLLSPLPLVIPMAYFLVVKVRYRLDRVLGFMDPWKDPLDIGFQLTNSLKAFGSGGLFGKGVGLSMQKMHFLPEPHTDFIFSIIGEELGLVGVTAILALYGLILHTGTRIARQSDTFFGAVTATGITLYLGLQVIINTGVTLGVLPTKGLTLPFISYGGTSLIINMAAMGILMNIGASANHAKK
ncbi:putative lipid II flippase FtsW [Desulfobacter postgatei]|uniref:Probable peptidoglycan glycosyltransferase FtsW n=1 Tax=Desulfobacter postgatei 2ac9 TaxID=879212 RepID=I5B3S9_9BACT|nr:putative lipid II flippase FtsW [Desulfobacter postgatei]EIM64142.1 cell division protein FtsW [Desulfobacter postgatei 2ac9]